MAKSTSVALGLLFVICLSAAWAQQPRRGEARGRAEGRGGPDDQPGPPPGGGPGRFMMIFPLMKALDTDQDGELSSREIKKAATSLKNLDTDEDGKLSEAELRPEMPARGPGGGGPGGPGGGPGVPGGGGPGGPGGGVPGGPGGPGGFGPPGPEQFVAHALEFDADGDGKLSKEELTKMAESFSRGPRARAADAGAPGDRPNPPRRPPPDGK